MRVFYHFLIVGSTLFMGVGASRAQENLIITSPASSTPGSSNTFVGIRAGNGTTTGITNTFVGHSAGNGNTSGEFNSFFGYQAGYYNTTGSQNVFVGRVAGGINLTGSSNTFLGYNAGGSNVRGSSNTILGTEAAAYKANGVSNVIIGARACFGQPNPLTLLGNNNVIVGDSAGYNQNGVNGSIFIGSKSGYLNQIGIQNTFLGYQTGYNNTASANTFIGFQAGRSNTTGAFNTFMGVNAGINNTSGSSNFIMGTNAGSNNTTGTANFFLGDNAGGSNSTGGYNVFLGTNAGVGNTVGANNTAIGFEANVGSGGLVNATAIGFRAVAAINNSVVLGNGANVGIGTTAPTNKLHLVSGTAGLSGLRLENLTSGNGASVLNQTKFLTVDGAGNVILGSLNSSAREAAAEGLWQRKGSYLESAKGEAVIIGSGVGKTPLGYKLFVEGGILTEKVKVAVKNTAEWSDYVFDAGYQLRSLLDIERYVQRHKHLPDVPSASEIVETGIDVAKMDAKLLQKIEELMLYTIQLEKTNQQQQQELQTIRQKQADLERLLNEVLTRK